MVDTEPPPVLSVVSANVETLLPVLSREALHFEAVEAGEAIEYACASLLLKTRGVRA